MTSAHNISLIPDAVEGRRKDLTPFKSTRGQGALGSLTIACILDNLSMASFGPEADFQPLTMRDWLVELTASQPDLLFVESAWRGFRNSWWNEVQKCGPELLGILDWCKSRGIPTVFWNKEDPVHFSTFLNAASLFDVVFTTDVDCVPRYKAALGHESVYFLPFAAQPAVHNPISRFKRTVGCSFAGAYYRKYQHRNRDFDELSVVLKELGQLDIYDRNYGTTVEENKFPDYLQSHIVGHLSPQDIDVAYKGYQYSLNLNSVKESQSMFARRVFELMASNTLVVSNYARGLKVMFGDLTFTTDSAGELRSCLDWIGRQENGLERLRTMGLRKVFKEHTYEHRLREIAGRAGLEAGIHSRGRVLLACRPSNQANVRRVVELLRSQVHEDWLLWLIDPPESLLEIADPRVETILSQDIAGMEIPSDFEYFGLLDEDSWYGDEYLSDLLDVFSWADVRAVGHAERFQFDSGHLVKVDDETAWSWQEALSLTRSIVRVSGFSGFFAALTGEAITAAGVAVSTLEYCEHGAGASDRALQAVRGLDIDQGISFDRLQRYASGLDPKLELEASGFGGEILPAELFDGVGNAAGLQVTVGDGKVKVVSDLLPGAHQYVYSQWPIAPFMLPDQNGGEVYFEATTGLNVMLALIYYSENGDRLGHTMVASSRNTKIEWPEGTTKVKVGIRALGPGTCTIFAYSRAPRKSAVHPPLARQRSLVLTNRYPSYESLYQNAFVASRAETYALSGCKPEIFCLDSSKMSVGYREFNGIEIATGNSEHLSCAVSHQRYENILVHFLSSEMWTALRNIDERQKVTVWVHGFEAQPWWRRKSLYTDPGLREQAVEDSHRRMSFWRDVFSSVSENWHFVFVSKYLAEQVFEDVGVALPKRQFSIIPNMVDPTLFEYEEKPDDQRFKVLSIRPYASAIYANDLAVQAVLELKNNSQDFDKFEFTFYGDGPLFESTLAPIAQLENVQIHQRFLTRQEIAQVHKEHGVFLVPSRMDTQGVSRGEAMSSGLVPVTNAVAAIPEFVDDSSGLSVDPEDSSGLAAEMLRLANDPELFRKLSRGAAARVRSQLGFERTIGLEMKLVGFTGREEY